MNLIDLILDWYWYLFGSQAPPHQAEPQEINQTIERWRETEYFAFPSENTKKIFKKR